MIKKCQHAKPFKNFRREFAFEISEFDNLKLRMISSYRVWCKCKDKEV